MKGYVYILSNPSMPGIVKVGRTSRSVHGRAGELYQTGVPTPFVVEHSVLSPDCVALERQVHETLMGQRVGPDREFFVLSVDEARKCVDYFQREQVFEFLHEYLPDYTAVESEFFIDPADILLVCDRADVPAQSLIYAFDSMSPEAVRECVDADAKKRAGWKVQLPSEVFGGLPN